MKSTKTKFEKIDLQELKKILPDAVMDGHNKRASDSPGKPKTKSAPQKNTTKNATKGKAKA